MAPHLCPVVVPALLPVCELRMGRPSRGTAGGSRQRSTHGRSAAFAWKVALAKPWLGFTHAAAALVDSAPWDKTAAAAAVGSGGAGGLGGSLPRRQRWCVGRWGKYRRGFGRWRQYWGWRLGARRVGGIHSGWAPHPLLRLPYIIYIYIVFVLSIGCYNFLILISCVQL